MIKLLKFMKWWYWLIIVAMVGIVYVQVSLDLSLPEYIGKMDIFVMPSLSESFGVSALEAESMEIPVVATNVGGIPEVVVNEVTGLLVKPNNHWALANAIIKLLSNNDLRTKMGKNGRKLVIEKYNWQENMEKIEKIYKSLI